MSRKFKESNRKVVGEEFSAELGEVSFHGDIRDCARTHSFKRKNRGR